MASPRLEEYAKRAGLRIVDPTHHVLDYPKQREEEAQKRDYRKLAEQINFWLSVSLAFTIITLLVVLR